MVEILLNQWSTTSSADAYKAPEQITLHLQGIAENHPRLGKGPITSSPIVKVNGRRVFTKSGSIYRLGKIDKKFRKYLREIRPQWDWREPITEVKI